MVTQTTMVEWEELHLGPLAQLQHKLVQRQVLVLLQQVQQNPFPFLWFLSFVAFCSLPRSRIQNRTFTCRVDLPRCVNPMDGSLLGEPASVQHA